MSRYFGVLHLTTTPQRSVGHSFCQGKVVAAQKPLSSVKSDNPLLHILAFGICITLTCQLGVIVQVFRYLCSLSAKLDPKEVMIQDVS